MEGEGEGGASSAMLGKVTGMRAARRSVRLLDICYKNNAACYVLLSQMNREVAGEDEKHKVPGPTA